MSKIIDAVTALAEPVADRHGCEIWEVEYVKEAGSWFLRVYIDHAQGVPISLCEAVSRELDPLLDGLGDTIPGSYIFEVSSAGAERKLRRPSDFDRFIGHLVEVKLYKSRDGKKAYVGNLDSYEDGRVGLDISGEKHFFEKPEIASARLSI